MPGATLFVEVGPQGVLTGLVNQILKDRPHLAVATDVKGRDGLVQLQHALAQLLVHGVPIRQERLYEDRDLAGYNLLNLEKELEPTPLSPMTWMVNGIRNRPLNAPEPFLLGQTMQQNGQNQAAPTPAEKTPSPKAEPKTNGQASLPPKRIAMRETMPSEQTAPAPTAAPASQNGHHAGPPAIVAQDQTSIAASNDDVTQVMHGFQNLMSRFLDTQRNVMLSYLQGGTQSAAYRDSPHAAAGKNRRAEPGSCGFPQRKPCQWSGHERCYDERKPFQRQPHQRSRRQWNAS